MPQRSKSRTAKTPLTITERMVLRRAQRHGYIVPPTRSISIAVIKLIAKGYLAADRVGFAITDAGRLVDAREPGHDLWSADMPTIE